jgi:hypothetical protein
MYDDIEPYRQGPSTTQPQDKHYDGKLNKNSFNKFLVVLIFLIVF